MTGDGSEVRSIKTWNVRSMNQGKLEVVKQEMARMNIDILGVSELKWTEMGEFNSDDHYIPTSRLLIRERKCLNTQRVAPGPSPTTCILR